MDLCASAAVIYWSKEEKCRSGRRICCLLEFEFIRRAFRGRTYAGNRANRLAITKVERRENNVMV